jgi:ketosteroid isomerase-like protein
MRLLPVLLFSLAASLAGAATPLRAPGAGAERAPPAAAAASINAVRSAEARRAQAVAKRDIATLRQRIGGAYYHVETNGRVRSKTEFLQLLTRDEFEFRSYGVDDMEITLHDNGRTAIVTGRVTAQTRGVTRPPEWRGRYVRVWTLQGDAWRNTLHQSTEIRPLPPLRDAQASALR